MPLLEVRDLVAGYGPIRALDGVSIHVDEGELVAIIGANGAGKSTLLMAVSGIVPPRSGSISCAGRPLAGLAPHEIVRLGIGQSPEGRRIFPRLTVRENLELGGFTQADRSRLDRDIAEARKLQQSLVGNRQAEFGQASIALMLHPSGHVGGDLVGWMPLSSRRVAFYAIDVSGHGVASAMMAARLAGILGGASGRGDLAFALAEPAPDRHILPPEAVLARLNRMVLEVMEVEQYFTCVWCDADLETGEVAIAQAGHPHPLLLRADGRVERVGRGGLPVGLVAEATHESVHLRLNPGDRLFLMSDGLLDVTGRDGGTLGEEGLIALARRNRALTGGAFLDALMWDVERLGGGSGGERSRRDAARAGEDDISGVLFCWHGPTGPR